MVIFFYHFVFIFIQHKKNNSECVSFCCVLLSLQTSTVAHHDYRQYALPSRHFPVIWRLFKSSRKHTFTQTPIILDNQMGNSTHIFELLISKIHKHTQLKRVDMGGRCSATPCDVDFRWFPREHVLTHHTTPRWKKINVFCLLLQIWDASQCATWNNYVPVRLNASLTHGVFCFVFYRKGSRKKTF